MWSINKKLYHSQLCYGNYGARICTPVASVVASRFVMIKIVTDDSMNSTTTTNSEVKTKKILFPSINRLFTDEKIHEIMIASHRLYEERFSSLNANLMLLDIQGFFPPCLAHTEVAGVMRVLMPPPSSTTSPSCSAIQYFKEHLSKTQQDDKQDTSQKLCIGIIDKLVLVPLSLLLHILYDAANDIITNTTTLEQPQRISLLVTSNDHTVCYLFDSSTTDRPKVYLFDSLEASLSDVTDSIFNDQTKTDQTYEFDSSCCKKQTISLQDQEYSGLILYHERDTAFFLQLFNI